MQNTQPGNKEPIDASLTDVELAERIASGDEAAFVALMRRYNQDGVPNGVDRQPENPRRN
jgi:hypothetical protein